jgi:predicted XRE-type DNA-binding protein
LAEWIELHHLKRADGVQILMVACPRVLDVVKKEKAKFTIDSLAEMLSRVGKTVRLTTG